MTQLLAFLAAVVIAVSAGRAAIMPEIPPTVNDPPVECTAEPITVEIPPVSEDEPEEPETIYRYAGSYFVTGYDICMSCCGSLSGITASGAVATVGRTVACNSLPFGTRIYIDGIGERVVEDRGGMAGNVIDVLCEDHPACYAITGTYAVYLIEEAE